MFTQLILLLLIPIISSISSEINDFQNICQAGIRQDNTNYIHCGRKQLTKIPNFSRITNTFYDELVLNDNQIIEIPSNAFQGLRVKRLNLSGNKIRFISLHAFRELSNYLEELIIEFDPNHIHQIPDAIKFNLINLRSLKLIDLNLSVLPNSTFKKFRKLEHLTIRKSNIKTIELDAFESLKTLRYLNLDQNQLNDCLWNKHLPNLDSLSLNQNQYKTFQNFAFPSLKSLDLSSNGLQSVEMKQFPLIEKLDLQNNELNSLQLIFLHELNHLKELNLDFNRLTFLPEKIFQKNFYLNYLSLQGNELNYLTNYSFNGLKNLIHLNLGRNRLIFPFDQQPFQQLKTLKILNLDRNLQMNLTKNILEDLKANLIELSLQNCNLTAINYSFEFLKQLQRLKLSSNYLKDLPNSFLSESVISLDLQRNLFRNIPNLRENNSSNLVDIDLSSNQISNLDEKQLENYPKLKTIGLTGNPLECNCQLRWIKQWLKRNYDQDLIKFLQWTCAKPLKLAGKQLTAIDEQDMICEEQEDVETTTSPSTTLSTTSTTTRLRSSTTKSSFNELIINDVMYNSNGLLVISWEYMSLRFPKYYHIKIYDTNYQNLIFERLIDGRERSVEVDISTYITQYPSTNILCINTRQKKSCRKISIPKSNVIKSASLILSSNKQQQETEQFIYLIGGILLGAILICSILIIVCYYHLHSYSKKQLSHEKSPKTFYYHPLNIISYPQQQQQQSTSNHTSECSLHSSIDTTQLTHDAYHIYQQIPSIQNYQKTQVFI